MKFLVDAQLPARLARFLGVPGTMHCTRRSCRTGNRTTDGRIAELADEEAGSWSRRIGTSETAICWRGPPQRLLVVAIGNITNTALLSLFETHLDTIATALGEADFVELGPDSLVVHRRCEDGRTR